VKVNASLTMHIVVDSIKYHTSRIGSITTIWLTQMNTNRKMNSNSTLLFLSIGIKGSFPTGHPEYHGFCKTDTNFLYSGFEAKIDLASSSGVWFALFLALLSAPLTQRSLHSLRLAALTAACSGVSPSLFVAFT
jgi:hypothetical protein